MAGVKISALPAVASALTTDFFPVVQGGVTSRETVAQLISLFNTNLVTPSNGGIVYTNATGLQVLSGTATANQTLLSGALSAPAWSTAVYPATTTINQLLYSSAANNITGLSTANSSVLLTSSGGVPSLGTVLPGGLTTTDPVIAQGLATKNYVDTVATGGGAAVIAATTGALTVTQLGAGVGATLTNAGAQAAFAIDGITPAVGARILVKNQTGGANTQNGVYILTVAGTGATNWVLTRATDYDTPSDINDTGVIPVQSGTLNANTGWLNTTFMVLVDTTAITFVQFGVSFPVSLGNGGTNASLTASNGGIFYSTASAGAILSGTATAGQLLQSGASTTPAWSTSTYPATNAVSTLLYASSANVMAALATANSGVLVTSATGVPSILAAGTTGQVLQASSAGTPAWSTATFPATAGTNGNVLTSNGTNWVSSAASLGNGYLNTQVITATGAFTYTPTAGTTYVIVELVGGGGGSGGTGSGVNGSCGGGSGSYAKFVLTAAQVGSSLTGSVGAGGSAGTAVPAAGGNAGNTTLATSAAWTVPGGNGGVAGTAISSTPINATTTNDSAATSAITSGTGTLIATVTGQKGMGGSAGIFVVNTTFIVIGGAGGSTPLGQGGQTIQQNTNTVGNVGTGYGSGGGGSTSINTGQVGLVGQPGVAIFHEFG